MRIDRKPGAPPRWTDPKRGITYALIKNTLTLWENGKTGPTARFPLPLACLAINPETGELIIADTFGQLWSHPPFAAK